MTHKIILALISIFLITATSCGPVKDCDEKGNEFYKYLKNKDFEHIDQYLDPEAIENTPIEIWRKGLEKKNADYGLILNVERRDFETHTSDNVTRVAIKYKVTYTKCTMYERLEFIERNADYKITYYGFDEDSTMVN